MKHIETLTQIGKYAAKLEQARAEETNVVAEHRSWLARTYIVKLPKAPVSPHLFPRWEVRTSGLANNASSRRLAAFDHQTDAERFMREYVQLYAFGWYVHELVEPHLPTNADAFQAIALAQLADKQIRVLNYRQYDALRVTVAHMLATEQFTDRPQELATRTILEALKILRQKHL